MTPTFYLYIVVMLHVGFATAILLWGGNERFSRLFGSAWLIEAVRAAILLPTVHTIGQDYVDEWFALADSLHFCSTVLLLASGAALVGKRISKRLTIAYFGVGIPTILATRYMGTYALEELFSLTSERANFIAILSNLIFMFLPATIARVIFAWWMYRTWRTTAAAGALVTTVFGIAYAVLAIAVPFQFYFDFNPPWMHFVWCLRVFGFSMGILMLIIARAENDLRESNDLLRSALRQLELAQKKAIGQERLKALGQMAAGVAHDINNSLTPLQSHAHLLQRIQDLPEEARHLTDMIQVSVEDTASKVRRLDHFYCDSHNEELLQSIDLGELVRQAINLTKPKWQNQARTGRQQISVTTTVSSRPQVRGEASQLRSVLTNLIFNACEAIEETGTIHLFVGSIGGFARVSVTDNGIGMSQEQLDHCLEPFYTTKAHGSGLGLSECRGIIRQHGGTIDIESEPGQSTTVILSLPIDHREPIEYSVQDPPKEFTDSAPTILCIDDDRSVAKATAASLELLPAKVEIVFDGAAALALMDEVKFDLVICDQGLPVMDGLAVLKEIKDRFPVLPVIMVSGWPLPEIRNGAKPDGFIAKPYKVERLHALVREQIRSSGNVSVAVD